MAAILRSFLLIVRFRGVREALERGVTLRLNWVVCVCSLGIGRGRAVVEGSAFWVVVLGAGNRVLGLWWGSLLVGVGACVVVGAVGSCLCVAYVSRVRCACCVCAAGVGDAAEALYVE
jgi:hypothetical protein